MGRKRGRGRVDGRIGWRRKLRSSLYFRFRSCGCRVRFHLQRRYNTLQGRHHVVSMSCQPFSDEDEHDAISRLRREVELTTQKFPEISEVDIMSGEKRTSHSLALCDLHKNSLLRNHHKVIDVKIVNSKLLNLIEPPFQSGCILLNPVLSPGYFSA